MIHQMVDPDLLHEGKVVGLGEDEGRIHYDQVNTRS